MSNLSSDDLNLARGLMNIYLLMKKDNEWVYRYINDMDDDEIDEWAFKIEE